MTNRFIALLAAVALLGGACGTSVEAGEVASLDDTFQRAGVDATESVDLEQAMLDMARCMRDEGVDVADPTVDEEGNVRPPRPADQEAFEREAFATAREACSQYLEGLEFGFRSVDQTELEDTLLEFAACMRDHGYDMPDPDLTAATPGQGGDGPFGDIDRGDPDFEAALEQCEDVLGDVGRGIGGGPRGGPGGGG